MKLTIAGEVKEIKDGTTVSELIVSENVETPEYVSVSVNEEFIGRDTFDTTVLQDGDVVEFLYFMGGGQQSGIYE
ncbi:MAG: sulfur carrier protein ThiS [Lachnospiraceae bacterium]|nr:sulfur carrier protein ThiS [Lachnospiraceae bacterium]